MLHAKTVFRNVKDQRKQIRSRVRSKESKKLRGTIAVLVILTAIVMIQILGFFFFNKQLYEEALEHSTEQVNELSMYVETNLQLELERAIHVLKVTEAQIKKEKGMSGEEMIEQLRKVQDISNFKVVGISTLNGKGVDSTGQENEIYYDRIREHIENEEVYISNVVKNGNEMLIFIAVPAKIQGKISGIFWAEYALADIVENIHIADNSYKYFQIVDDRGNYLLPVNSKYALNHTAQFEGPSIWVELEDYDYADGMTAEKIHDMARRGESGNFYFKVSGQGRYVNFRPLKINNWYLFSVQVEEELNTSVYTTRRIVVQFFVMLALGLLIIFGVAYCLIYSMYRKIAKQHRELEVINSMLQSALRKTKSVPFTIDQKLRQIAFFGYSENEDPFCCSFEAVSPKNMMQRGMIAPESFQNYQKVYQSLLVDQKQCEPTVLYLQVGNKIGWMRLSIVSDAKNDRDQMIGVIEDYEEQQEKDVQIQNHLDDIKKIEEKSKIDYLTGIYNRNAFLEKIREQLLQNHREKCVGALLILDIDHFKEVNDCLGHGMGDLALQQASDVLRKYFCKEDIVGRLGGDEFVVFVKKAEDSAALKKQIQQLNMLLCKDYGKDGHTVQVTASIGIVQTGEEYEDFKSLYEKADKALYRVKQNGRNGFCIWS